MAAVSIIYYFIDGDSTSYAGALSYETGQANTDEMCMAVDCAYYENAGNDPV